MVLQVFWGASPVGPYNLNRSGSPAERLQRVRTVLFTSMQHHPRHVYVTPHYAASRGSS